MTETKLKNLTLNDTKLDSPIFIGGEGRSGTRLLRTVLGKHSSIFEVPRETYIFATKNIKGNKFHSIYANNKEIDLLVKSVISSMFFKRSVAIEKSKNKNFDEQVNSVFNLIKESESYHLINNKYDAFNLIVNHLTLNSNKRRWIEKTPSNIYSAKEILELYPKAKIIAIFRDPRAVCASWLKKDKLKSLFGVCLSWNRAINQMVKLSKEIPDNFYVLKFEDLVSSPEPELKKLCVFLNENYETEMMNISVTNSHFMDTKNIQGFSAQTIDRWKNTLSADQKMLIDTVTNKYRKKLSYVNCENLTNNTNILRFTVFVFKSIYLFIVNKFKKLFLK